jgi:hypothetical protein
LLDLKSTFELKGGSPNGHWVLFHDDTNTPWGVKGFDYVAVSLRLEVRGLFCGAADSGQLYAKVFRQEPSVTAGGSVAWKSFVSLALEDHVGHVVGTGDHAVQLQLPPVRPGDDQKKFGLYVCSHVQGKSIGAFAPDGTWHQKDLDPKDSVYRVIAHLRVRRVEDEW